jgi:hypothetical protein
MRFLQILSVVLFCAVGFSSENGIAGKNNPDGGDHPWWIQQRAINHDPYRESLRFKELQCNDMLNPALVLAKNIQKKGFKHLQLNLPRAAVVAKRLVEVGYPLAVAEWNFPPYPQGKDIQTMVSYFLVLDAVNYMYWDPADPKKYYGTHVGTGSDRRWVAGATLIAQRLEQKLDSWVLKPARLAHITAKQIQDDLFPGEVPLPNLEMRAQHLREVGKFLTKLHVDWPDFLELFETPLSLARWIGNTIPGYGADPFLKRAQLFVGMLVGYFYKSDSMPSQLKNFESMTAYADYLLPVMGVRLGLIKLGGKLRAKIENRELIPADSEMENELRAATIIYIRALRKELRKYPKYSKVTDPMLDTMAWLNGALLTGEIAFLPDFLKIPEDLIVDPLSVHPLIETTHY